MEFPPGDSTNDEYKHKHRTFRLEDLLPYLYDIVGGRQTIQSITKIFFVSFIF